jgi:hypothetical protein
MHCLSINVLCVKSGRGIDCVEKLSGSAATCINGVENDLSEWPLLVLQALNN